MHTYYIVWWCDTRKNTSHILKTLLLLILLFLFVWFGVVTHPRRGNIHILILILGKDKTPRLHSILLVKTLFFFFSFVHHLSFHVFNTPHPHASLYVCSSSSTPERIKKMVSFYFFSSKFYVCLYNHPSLLSQCWLILCGVLFSLILNWVPLFRVVSLPPKMRVQKGKQSNKEKGRLFPF